MHAGVTIDTTWGTLPLTVQFSGWCDLPVEDWSWTLGDGTTEYTQDVSHTFDVPGTYDVTLKVVVAAGDTLVRQERRLVSILADTVWAEQVTMLSDDAVEVTIGATNHAYLNELTIPIEFAGDMDIDPLAVTWATAGCRTEGFGILQVAFNPAGSQVTLRLQSDGASALPPGSGAILKLTFELPGNISSGDINPITVHGYSSYVPSFEALFGSYEPEAVDGSITFLGCCLGMTGNIDGDLEQEINISDLIHLVTFMFQAGPEPPCMEEADVNGDGTVSPNIADLIDLVSFMFQDGPDPADCL